MIFFWAAAAVLSALAAGLILFRAQRGAARPAADATAGLYARQLKEIDELVERGVLAPGEEKGARDEARRRLLAAADKPAPVWSDGKGRLVAVVAAAGLAPVLAAMLYIVLGAPGFPDQPYKARVEAWRSASPETLRPQQLAALLRDLTRERPKDPEGWRYLALAERASGRPTASARALRKALELTPDDAALWEELGESLVMEGQGGVPTAAQEAFREALKRQPGAVAARFRLAQAKVEEGNRDEGLAEWRALLAQMPAGDPRRETVSAAIAEMSGGPSAQQMAAAAAQPGGPDIRAMVDGLAARLKAQPDDAEGWVRLVRSYGVLGEDKLQAQALGEARKRFAARPDVLNALTEAAAR